jgi:hypothetical protein
MTHRLAVPPPKEDVEMQHKAMPETASTSKAMLETAANNAQQAMNKMLPSAAANNPQQAVNKELLGTAAPLCMGGSHCQLMQQQLAPVVLAQACNDCCCVAAAVSWMLDAAAAGNAYCCAGIGKKGYRCKSKEKG